jgi:formylglycine-generating enzyme required for sulfatase activity
MARITAGSASFCIDVHEVTVSEYAACAHAKACTSTPSNDWPGIHDADHALFDPSCNARARDKNPRQPINCVDYKNADAYCYWRGAHLPTSKEWEAAAGGASGRTFPWGDAPAGPKLVNACGRECSQWKRDNAQDLGRATLGDLAPTAQAYDADDGWLATAPAGTFAAGWTPAGDADLAGNVAEWVDDASAGASLAYAYGGSWLSIGETQLRSVARAAHPKTTRAATIGFRCAAKPSP